MYTRISHREMDINHNKIAHEGFALESRPSSNFNMKFSKTKTMYGYLCTRCINHEIILIYLLKVNQFN